MKTLVYKTVFCCKGHFYNDGFIVAQINDDGKLRNMEGILTDDYLKAEVIEKEQIIKITIYFKNYESGNMEEFITIDVNDEEFELPICLNVKNVENLFFELRIVEKIHPAMKYMKRLEMFKKNNVFEKGRS